MTKLTPRDARITLAGCVGPDWRTTDFHALHSRDVEMLLREADRTRYRATAARNSSRASYYHAYLMRVALRGGG